MKEMKRTLLLLMLISLGHNNIYAQDMPKYYLNIQNVLSSPYTLHEDSSGLYFNFRALSASQEGHFYLIIEKIKLGEEGKDKSLIDHFYLRSEDFSLSLIDEVEFLEWISKYKFLVKIGGKDVYEVDVSKHDTDKIKVMKLK
tara:strand:+ start:7805 stop:8230 length:426 start_codon:yes stop_codon:yes gene_type:complete